MDARPKVHAKINFAPPAEDHQESGLGRGVFFSEVK